MICTASEKASALCAEGRWVGLLNVANVSGLLVGIGIAVSDRAFISTEFVMRDPLGDKSLVPAYIRTRQQAIQLHAGINF